jgi:hypothetical protein
VSHLSNQELVVIAGEPALVRHVVEAAGGDDLGATGITGATGVTGAASLPASVPASIAAPEVVAAGLVDRLQQTR